jgi:uncharacterized coiled-coil DUF342 family protein
VNTLKNIFSKNDKLEELDLKFDQIKSDISSLSALVTRTASEIDSLHESLSGSESDIKKLKDSTGNIARISQQKFDFYDSQLANIDDALAENQVKISEIEVLSVGRERYSLIRFLRKNHLLVAAYTLMLAAAGLLAWLLRLNI